MKRISALPLLCLSLISCGTSHHGSGNFVAMSESDFDPSLAGEVVKFSSDFAADNGFVVTGQTLRKSPLNLTLSSLDVTIHVTENQQFRRLHIDASGVPTSRSIKVTNKYITAVGEIHR